MDDEKRKRLLVYGLIATVGAYVFYVTVGRELMKEEIPPENQITLQALREMEEYMKNNPPGKEQPGDQPASKPSPPAPVDPEPRASPTPVLPSSTRPRTRLDISEPQDQENMQVLLKKRVGVLRDPFKRPPLAQSPEANLSELQRHDLNQFSLSGIMLWPKRNRAVVTGPDSRAYFLTEGTAIGNRQGRVVEIQNDRVKVREKMVNVLGDTEEVESWLFLKGSEE